MRYLPVAIRCLAAGIVMACHAAGAIAQQSTNGAEDPVPESATEAARRGEFRQVLTTAGDPRRWVYEGRYAYSPGDGLRWHIERPIRGSLHISGNGDSSVEGELGGLQILSRRTVARLVHAMVAMDRDVLGRYYHVRESRNKDGFEIVLTARERYRHQAGTVTMRGREQVDSVRFEFPDGRLMALDLQHD